jgi:hypothetical protein
MMCAVESKAERAAITYILCSSCGSISVPLPSQKMPSIVDNGKRGRWPPGIGKPVGYGFIQNWNKRSTLALQNSRIDQADQEQFAASSRSH